MEVQLPDSMVESQLTGILQELQQHLDESGRLPVRLPAGGRS